MIFSLVLTAYHLSGWLSKHHRFRVLLFRPNFSQCISQTLLSSLVGGIIFVFFTFGLPSVLTFTKPTSWELKVIFCIFSSGSLPQGVCTIVLATQCVKIIPELYCVSMMLSMSSMTSAATSLPGKFPQGCSRFPTPFIMKKLTEPCSSHSGKIVSSPGLEGLVLLGVQTLHWHQLEELLWEQEKEGAGLAFVMHKAPVSKEAIWNTSDLWYL
ncbi:protein LZIC isoform C [Alligator mississippiensis]|uniref:Protein LZIC isoform C n=1 Tax=Alligator mississippiensis TaxID=8496 RepID=A0A151N4I0_ALLMI|nr:protein LZIC isoform C [Alligator mississippiensis]